LPCIFFPFLIQFVCTFHQDISAGAHKEQEEEEDVIEGYENANYENDDEMSLSMSMHGSKESFLAIKEATEQIEKETSFADEHDSEFFCCHGYLIRVVLGLLHFPNLSRYLF